MDRKDIEKPVIEYDPAQNKIQVIFLNLLLLVTFALILVSGILISKTVFTGISAQSPVWKTVHYTAAAAALVFTGGSHRTSLKIHNRNA